MVTTDGRLVISSSRDESVKVWELESGKEISAFTCHSATHGSMAIIPDGKNVVIASGDGSLEVWNLESGRELRRLINNRDLYRSARILSYGIPLEIMAGRIVNCSVVVTDDRRWVISCQWDNVIDVWDYASGKIITSFYANANILDVAVTPDGRTIVAGDSIGGVYFLRLILPEDEKL